MPEKLKSGGDKSSMVSPFSATKDNAPGEGKAGTLPPFNPPDPTGVVPKGSK